jgi:hypothetical protein
MLFIQRALPDKGAESKNRGRQCQGPLMIFLMLRFGLVILAEEQHL